MLEAERNQLNFSCYLPDGKKNNEAAVEKTN